MQQVLHLFLTPSGTRRREMKQRGSAHLDVLGQRDDKLLVHVDDNLRRELGVLRRRADLGVARLVELLAVEGGLFVQSTEQSGLDGRFGDERGERVRVRVEDVRNKVGRGRAELGLGDELACALVSVDVMRKGGGDGP